MVSSQYEILRFSLFYSAIFVLYAFSDRYTSVPIRLHWNLSSFHHIKKNTQKIISGFKFFAGNSYLIFYANLEIISKGFCSKRWIILFIFLFNVAISFWAYLRLMFPRKCHCQDSIQIGIPITSSYCTEYKTIFDVKLIPNRKSISKPERKRNISLLIMFYQKQISENHVRRISNT